MKENKKTVDEALTEEIQEIFAILSGNPQQRLQDWLSGTGYKGKRVVTKERGE